MEGTGSWNREGPPLVRHAFLLLDGSGSMEEKELRSGLTKHRAVAEMVQDLINELHEEDEIQEGLLTIICYDSTHIDDIRLSAYDVRRDEDYLRPGKPYSEDDLNRWDPFIGHGMRTPIGRVLAFAREKAEEWVLSAPGGTIHRAVICLMSDGMNYPPTEPNGMEENNSVQKFTNNQISLEGRGEYKGRIRIVTVGYFQHQKGQNEEEDQGRELLSQLAFPDTGYFETPDAKKIVQFLVKTLTTA